MYQHRPDAIIYLFGEIARTTDQNFLEEFHQVTGEQWATLSTIGVMAKIDLQPDFPDGPISRAAKITEQFKSELNIVLPVSAEMQRTLMRLQGDNRTGLSRLFETLARIPAQLLGEMLQSDEWFCYEEYPESPLSAAERKQLLGDLDWQIFKMLVEEGLAANWEVKLALPRLEQLTGYGPLRLVLQERFFERSDILRCLRVITSANAIINAIRFSQIPILRKQVEAMSERRARFLGFIRQAKGDPAVRQELEEFILLYANSGDQVDRAEGIIGKLDYELDKLYQFFQQVSSDLDSLQLLEQNAQFFSPEARDELRALFGFQGGTIEQRLRSDTVQLEYVRKRNQHWTNLSQLEAHPIRQRLAQRAMLRYGLIQREIGVRGS